MIGKTISHYKIVENLGGGGMGVVYKAEDTKLKRTVALKFLPTALSLDFEAKTRFIHEAQAASALQHNNICTIHEIDETEDGQMFICMDFYEGETLKKKVERGPLKIEDALDITIQIANGLASAHEAKEIHRDIKPANIMITDKSDVKIVDFGLARLAGQTQLTKEGTTVGTIAYMSPEQARGNPVDHRTDIWSLGIVLYEMLTGRQPFRGEYDQAMIYSIINEEPEPPSSLNPEISSGIERIINTMLSKNPEKRYQLVDELLSALSGLIKELESEIPSVSRLYKAFYRKKRLWRHPAFIIISALFIVLLVIVFQKLLIKDSEISEPIPAENSLAVLYFENLKDPEDSERLGRILQELIITDLSDITNLKVISSQRLYDIQKQLGIKNPQKIDKEMATTVAKRAGAITMLTGNIIQLGMRFVFTSQLVDVYDGNVIKSQRVDGSDLYVMVDDLTNQVYNDLNLTIAQGDKFDLSVREKTTASMQAYKHFLTGVDFMNNMQFDTAITEFQQAISLDSSFSQAYYKMGIAQWWAEEATDNKARESLTQILSNRFYSSDKEKNLAKGAFCLIERKYGDAISIYKDIINNDPDEKEAWYGLGEAYFHYGTYHKALEAFEKSIELDPSFKIAYRHIFHIYQINRKYTEAILHARNYLVLEPENPLIHRYLVESLIIKGDSIEIERALKEALRYNKSAEDQIRLFVSIGESYGYTKKYEAQEKYCRMAIALDPEHKDPEVLNNMGWVFIRQEKYEEAEEFLLKALAILPRHPAMLNGLIYLNKKRKDYDKAIKYAKMKQESKPESGLFYGSLLLVYVESYRLAEADSVIKEGLAELTSIPAKRDLLRQAAWAYSRRRKYEISYQFLKRAQNLDPESTDIKLLEELAKIYIMQRNLTEAEKYLKNALAIDSSDASLYRNMGYLFIEREEFFEAKMLAEKSMSLEENFHNYNLLSWILIKGNLDINRGFDLANKAFDLRPDYKPEYPFQALPANTLGLAYIKRGQYEKAVKYLESAVEIAPDRQSIKDDLNLARKKLKSP